VRIFLQGEHWVDTYNLVWPPEGERGRDPTAWRFGVVRGATRRRLQSGDWPGVFYELGNQTNVGGQTGPIGGGASSPSPPPSPATPPKVPKTDSQRPPPPSSPPPLLGDADGLGGQVVMPEDTRDSLLTVLVVLNACVLLLFVLGAIYFATKMNQRLAIRRTNLAQLSNRSIASSAAAEGPQSPEGKPKRASRLGLRRGGSAPLSPAPVGSTSDLSIAEAPPEAIAAPMPAPPPPNPQVDRI